MNLWAWQSTRHVTVCLIFKLLVETWFWVALKKLKNHYYIMLQSGLTDKPVEHLTTQQSTCLHRRTATASLGCNWEHFLWGNEQTWLYLIDSIDQLICHTTTYYTSLTTTIFIVLFLRLCRKRIFEENWRGFLTGEMPFLSLSQQSTPGTHSINSNLPHPFFSLHQTPRTGHYYLYTSSPATVT